jgi:RNA polymerase sigma-70 factor (ECF subfamily)
VGPAHAKPQSAEELGRSISSARDGSFAALGQLFDHYRDYLLRMANDELASALIPKISPSDLVQETFLDAAKDFPQFRGRTESELQAWLRHILLNNLSDARRKYVQSQKRSILCEVPLQRAGNLGTTIPELRSADSSISAPLVRAEEAVALRAALDRLSEDQRRVIELRTYQGLSFEQVGAACGRSSEAARKLWARAIENLAYELAKQDG